MSKRHRLSVAAAACITAGALLYLAFGRQGPGQDERSIDLALVQEMLKSSQETSTYRLIPVSVMTGLCWGTDDGIREGIFRDVNPGMAHWRDHVPQRADQAKSTAARPASPAANDIVYAWLSRQLVQLSFGATAYRFTAKSAEVTGELEVGDHKREVIMTAGMPVQQSDKFSPNTIELNASTELGPEDLDDPLPATANRPLNLCITMQAVKESALAPSAGDEPLMLGHYYQ